MKNPFEATAFEAIARDLLEIAPDRCAVKKNKNNNNNDENSSVEYTSL